VTKKTAPVAPPKKELPKKDVTKPPTEANQGEEKEALEKKEAADA